MEYIEIKKNNKEIEIKESDINCGIDWLSLNFKGVDAYTLLETFCESVKHQDVKIENFIYQERGVVTGYTESYSYLGTNYIVVSFATGRDNMGVNIQITGQGCKLIYINDIISFLENMTQYTNDYKCNRLDIALDDFVGFIPVDEIVETTRKEITDKEKQHVISRIKRDMISIYLNHFDGNSSENVLYGKHRSARSFRLYDKKIEQKLTDEQCKYWYRLEIELRTKGKSQNADIAFHEFITRQKSIFDIFVENITTMVTFIRPISFGTQGGYDINNLILPYWKKFVDFLFSVRIRYIMRTKFFI